MAKKNNDTLLQISHWAVGRSPGTSEVALKLNDLSPLLMSVESAREIAMALKSEADAVGQLKPLPGGAGRSKQSLE